MKWLAGGLTFVNIATVCGLLLGMARGGLNKSVAISSLMMGFLAGAIAYVTTANGRPEPKVEVAVPVPETRSARRRKKQELVRAPLQSDYKVIWLWLVGACFAFFAFRSFCWLLYIGGDELKIQSPNNLGDIALHITHIQNFASGVALWPENPIYAFSTLQYPAGIDLFDALFVLLQLDLKQVLIWTSLLGSLATFYGFWRWSGAFGVASFLFNGGLAGFEILHTGQWLDYQGHPSIAWKSIPLAMLVTQRGLLYAIPVGLLLLYQWRVRFSPVAGVADPGPTQQSKPPLPFWVECALYASMPLFHLHTFIALSIVLLFLFLFQCPSEIRSLLGPVHKGEVSGHTSPAPDQAKRRIIFGYIRNSPLLLVGCAILPATFLVWLVTDHFHAQHILEWKPGWVATDGEMAKPFFKFWLVNFGLTIPLVVLLVGYCSWRFWKSATHSLYDLPSDLAFLASAIVIFLFACTIKTAPWYWDNIKLIIWAYFIVLPFLWRDLIRQWPVAVRACICIALFGSGFVSLVGGLAAGDYGFANRAEVDAVGQAVIKLPAEERFAAYPTYNHPLLLNGRKVVLGYPGHLASQGFDFGPTEQKLNALMQGAPNWRELAHQLRARYLFWGREERLHYPTSTRPWENTSSPVVAGDWGEIYDLEPAETPRPVLPPR